MVKLAIIEDEEDILAVTLKLINDYCPFVTRIKARCSINGYKSTWWN